MKLRSLCVIACLTFLLLASGRTMSAEPRIRDIASNLDPEGQDLAALVNTWGANVAFDHNQDGWTDLLLSHHWADWKLLLGQLDGSFHEFLRIHDGSTNNAGDIHACVTADFGSTRGPRDGRVDIYCIRGARGGTIDDKSNVLAFQEADGSLSVNRASDWGVADGAGRGRSVAILDVKANGLPGLYVGNERKSRYESVNRIYENIGGHFVETAVLDRPRERNSHCAITADFDDDGSPDLFSCSNRQRLYRNSNGQRFSERSLKEGLPDERVSDAAFADIDKDSWPDLITIAPRQLVIRRNRRRTPHFSRVHYRIAVIAGISFCVGDADGNGTEDILVVLGRPGGDIVQEADRLLLNDGSGRNFAELAVPQPRVTDQITGARGEGDTCTAIPNYRGRHAAFLVNNGKFREEERYQSGFRQFLIME